MKIVEKNISQFIESQFPALYREEGPILVAFVQSYFEWLEEEGNINYKARRLFEYRDIDSTLDEYIVYFKNKYASNLPLDTATSKKLLIKKGFRKIFLYTSPFYMPNQKITDRKFIQYINKIKPNFILLNIAGFKQELLAEYIDRKIKFNINTFCLGAAIAFMTKKQAPINFLIDRFYMGWFFRLLFRPKEHFKRTVESFTLIKLFINNF